jgi:hypothetical protein
MWADAQEPLAIIEAHESGGRNVPNYINDAWHTACGYWQITNTTWRGAAAWAGVDLAQYPTACTAPRAVQQSVATALFDHLGVLPWAPFNAGLAVQLGYTGPMYDENGHPTSGPIRAVNFYGQAAPRARQSSDEVWE